MMTQQYLAMISQNHKAINTNDVNGICQGTIKELIGFKNVIPNFFLDTQGTIHHIYTQLRHNKYPYNKIQIVDLYSIRDLFQEYYIGMNEFCDTLITLDEESSLKQEDVKKKIDHILARDKEYRSEMFDQNKKSVEVNLSEAMYQIEFLIDFMPSIDEFCDTISAKVSMIASDASPYKGEKARAIGMLAQLIRHYSYHVVCNIFIIFDSIVSSMEHKVTFREHNKPRYKMFA